MQSLWKTDHYCFLFWLPHILTVSKSLIFDEGLHLVLHIALTWGSWFLFHSVLLLNEPELNVIFVSVSVRAGWLCAVIVFSKFIILSIWCSLGFVCCIKICISVRVLDGIKLSFWSVEKKFQQVKWLVRTLWQRNGMTSPKISLSAIMLMFRNFHSGIPKSVLTSVTILRFLFLLQFSRFLYFSYRYYQLPRVILCWGPLQLAICVDSKN